MDEYAAALALLLERAVRDSVFDGSYCVSCGQGDCREGTAYSPLGHDEDCWVREAAVLLGIWDHLSESDKAGVSQTTEGEQ